LGGRYSFRHFEAGLHYVDTDLARRGAGATVVASLGFRF
jgi:hypothetical protein